MLSRILKFKQVIIKYQIDYQKNLKTPKIQILPTGDALVIAPQDTKIQELDNFIKNKISWIIQKQKEKENKLHEEKEREYKEDEIFYYIGNALLLKFHDEDGSGERVIAQVDDGILTIYIKDKNNKKRVKELISYWFKKKAEILLKNEAKELFLKYRDDFEFISELDIVINNSQITLSKSKYIKSDSEDVKNK